MFTFVVLAVIAFLWWSANRNFMATAQWKYRRLRSAYAWAFLGASVGSFFGVAGMGSAIAGTIPGAIVGYLLASNMMKRDPE